MVYVNRKIQKKFDVIVSAIFCSKFNLKYDIECGLTKTYYLWVLYMDSQSNSFGYLPVELNSC